MPIKVDLVEIKSPMLHHCEITPEGSYQSTLKISGDQIPFDYSDYLVRLQPLEWQLREALNAGNWEFAQDLTTELSICVAKLNVWIAAERKTVNKLTVVSNTAPDTAESNKG
jgi:hypothetical protein